MRDQAPSIYRHVSYFIEIALGLILVLNGILLLFNSAALFSFKEQFLDFLSSENLSNKSAQEWRIFVEFLHAFVSTHISIFVLLCMGIVIFLAGLHTKRSL
jgi:multisubunit Na+/H+ antiporter MnhB subunit